MAKSERAPERQRAFGHRVRELRQTAGLSQEELAHAAGLHRTYVGAVERGERNLALDAIWRIADALGIHPTELFVESPRDAARSVGASQPVHQPAGS